MELEILEQAPTFTRIAMRGRLDTAGVDQIETKLNASLTRAGHGVVDLSEVTFLASLGIRLLVTAAKMLNRRGGRLVLVAPQPLVDQALRHSHLDDLIPVAPDVDGAMALLRS